jgi:hypothetical protein
MESEVMESVIKEFPNVLVDLPLICIGSQLGPRAGAED